MGLLRVLVEAPLKPGFDFQELDGSFLRGKVLLSYRDCFWRHSEGEELPVRVCFDIAEPIQILGRGSLEPGWCQQGTLILLMLLVVLPIVEGIKPAGVSILSCWERAPRLLQRPLKLLWRYFGPDGDGLETPEEKSIVLVWRWHFRGRVARRLQCDTPRPSNKGRVSWIRFRARVQWLFGENRWLLFGCHFEIGQDPLNDDCSR